MAVQDDQLFDPEVQHSLVRKIPNKSTKTKARASLPDILYLKEVYCKIGIFTNGSLPKATQFGPLEAPLATKNQMDEPAFPMKLDIRKCRRLESSASSYVYYDTTDENMCNWMMLVQPASVFLEQNLCAYQNEDFVYFTTTREIQADEELKVWYSPTYAKFMGAGLLTPTSGAISVPMINPGRQKSRKSKSTRRMQVYPNSLVLERDVRSIPPKKRGWKRTKRMDAEVPNRISPRSIPPRREPTKNKNLACEICKKTFKDRTKLTVHSVVHSSARNFLCDHCGATFKRKDKLREHEIRLHDVQKLKLVCSSLKNWEHLEKFEYKCDDCKIGFHRRGMLINHIMKRHPDSETVAMEQLNRPVFKVIRKFQCPYCDKGYRSNTKRKVHIKKHHPEKPLPQSLKRKKCDKMELTDNNIITETSVVIKPFSCPYCTMQYSMKHKMDKHIKQKHAEFYQGRETKQKKLHRPSSDNNEQVISNSIEANAFQHQGTPASNDDAEFQPTEHIECSPPFCATAALPVISAPTVSHHQNIEEVQPSQKGVASPSIQNEIQPTANQNMLFPYNSSYDGLLSESLLPREPVSIPGDFQNCRTMEADEATSHSVADLFGNSNAAVQPLSNDLAAPDFLNQELDTLEGTEVANEAPQPQIQQHYNHTGVSRSETHYRYHCGRKGILRYYEDSQNQLMQSQSNTGMQYERPRQLPYKARLLNNETYGRPPWMGEEGTDVATEIRPSANNGSIYLPFANEQPQSCVIETRATLDSMMVDSQRLSNLRPDWNDNDVATLMNASRTFLFEPEPT